MRSKFLKPALHFVGPLLLLLLIWRAGPNALWNIFRRAHPGWLFLAFLLNFPQLGLKAWRWHRLVQWQGMRLSYSRTLLAYFSSLLIGFLTPGRLGEMAKAITLKEECGVSFAAGLSSVVADRMFDMYLLLVLGMLGILQSSFVGTRISWPAFLLVSILFMFPLLFLHERSVRRMGDLITAVPGVNRHKDSIKLKINQYAAGLTILTPPRLLKCMLWTLAAYGFFLIQCELTAHALRITNIRLLDMSFMMAATNFISFIPISISGLGTREACLVYFMARLPVSYGQELAVAFGLALFLVFFVGGGAIGLVAWQIAPLGVRGAVKSFRKKRIDHQQ